MSLLRGAGCECRSRMNTHSQASGRIPFGGPIKLIEGNTVLEGGRAAQVENVNQPSINEVVKLEIFWDSVVGGVMRARLLVR